MIDGYVVNNSGRGRHIFKRPVSPGSKVLLSDLYKLYAKHSNGYKGEFDGSFLDWLKKNKVPDGFDVIVNEIDKPKEEKPRIAVVGSIEEKKKILEPKKIISSSLTAKEISELKTKDNPKKVIQEVLSKHKLRRALTLCKDRPGKGTLVKLIRARISELP